MSDAIEAEESPLATLRGYLALEGDVFVLSVAMFAFSPGYQGTNQYMAEYLFVLGAGPVVVGLFGSLGNFISAIHPYPGGVISDRIGSRHALALFGLLSAVGFAIWALGLLVVSSFALGPVTVPELACRLLSVACCTRSRRSWRSRPPPSSAWSRSARSSSSARTSTP